jgi:hypothetical protein
MESYELKKIRKIGLRVVATRQNEGQHIDKRVRINQALLEQVQKSYENTKYSVCKCYS